MKKPTERSKLSTARVRASAMMTWRIAWVRLRFVLLVGAVVLLVAQWDQVSTRVAAWLRRSTPVDIATQSVSGDTEYFCPMDPGVVSDWPSVCGVCHMTLVRRKRGDLGPLPEGVMARMQLSPYRLYLGGVQTTPATYAPLVREIEVAGRVIEPADGRSPARILIDASHSDADLLMSQPALKLEIDGDAAHLIQVSLSPKSESRNGLVVEVDQTTLHVRPSQHVICKFAIPVAALEPYRSQPSDPPPVSEGELRAIYACPDHPATVATTRGLCALDNKELHRIALDDNQRLRWWCPMHSQVTSEREGAVCEPCNGMKLVPHVIRYRPEGQVLAVAESAVVDTGRRKFVYVERMPGMFDAVEVSLGPRCGGEYPVISGIDAGQRVVSQGAFLVDAETRLNPSLAVGYFGATPQGADAHETTTAKARNSNSDSASIAAQRICPVTGKALGSMGMPVRVEVADRVVFLCCAGCESALRDDASKYLKKLEASTDDSVKDHGLR